MALNTTSQNGLAARTLIAGNRPVMWRISTVAVETPFTTRSGRAAQPPFT
jgi:hypothetical protein